MADSPRRHMDLAALTLLVLGLLTALAVLSADPRDQGSRLYPPPAAPSNLLGWPGAWVAGCLLRTLGFSTYVLLTSWLMLVVLLLLRRGWLTWLLRIGGWVVLIPAAAVLAALFPQYLPAPGACGPGGSLGAWLRHWLVATFEPTAQVVVLASVILGGALLALDLVLVRLARLAWGGGRISAGMLAALARRTWGLLRPTVLETAEVPARKVRAAREKPAPLDEPAGEDAGPGGIQIQRHEPLAGAGSAPEGAGQEEASPYQLPPPQLLEDARPFAEAEHEQQLRERAALLEKTFADFGLNLRVVGINTGPVITQYEVALETGLRLHKVTRLADDIALNLRVPSVRMVAPIPGKNTVGVEVPNDLRADVRLKEVMQASAKQVARAKIPLFLGKDSEGRPLAADLAEMPHLLIAGRTGTGKSVCMNAIILSILMTRRPDEVRMIMIDPKMLEMAEYGRIPHLMHPVVTDMKKAEAILAWAVDKMEERYDLLSRARVRNIASYNELRHEEILRRVQPADDAEREAIPERMPYIVIFVDEMADLIMRMKKEVEGHIIRLAQKSRAAGIHLVVATQKPTVDVITGLIKSNLPARICFKVVNKSDSRVVLDEMGADKLLGRGDLLFLQPGTTTLVRAQGAYASDEEIHRVVEHLEGDPCYVQELIELPLSDEDTPVVKAGEGGGRKDALYDSAVEVVLREGRGSVSLLQRALGIGYGRAARLIDYMAEDGVVGGYNGSSAREVLLSPEEWAAQRSAG